MFDSDEEFENFMNDLRNGKFETHRLKKEKGIYRKLKDIYEIHTTDIMEAYSYGNDVWSDPYFVDWMPLFSPIETHMWYILRGGMTPFYPQYPIEGAILDFAHIGLKIAIECDGKDWHEEGKDKKRDLRLMESGWKTFRIKGSEFYTKFKFPDEISDYLDEYYRIEDNDEYINYVMNTPEGVVEAIKKYYIYEEGYNERHIETLKAHTYLDLNFYY